MLNTITNLKNSLIKQILPNSAKLKVVEEVNFNRRQEVSVPECDNDFLAKNFPVRFINKFANKEVIEKAIRLNPEITRMLNELDLSVNIQIENVTSIIMSHLIPTAKMATKIFKKMGHKQDETQMIQVLQAALLHDIGKALIPSEILNKNGRLSYSERRIVELHNKLGSEIIKTTNLGTAVAQLILEHHDYDKSVDKNHANQALTIADVYCALREKRPYKKPINNIRAKAILYDMGLNGKLDTRYISLIG